mmetsp:Transcript_54734/g.120031  ORF Transcript_54734/g.120031 Transcript_54734/m.120031 type:complete len:201 (-) Transcript_54734:462-1064(-)
MIRLMSKTALQSSSSLSSSMATRTAPGGASSSPASSTTSSILGSSAFLRFFSASIRSSSSTVLRNRSNLSEDRSSGCGSGTSSPTFFNTARVASPSFSALMVRSSKRLHSLSSGYNAPASSRSNLACDHWCNARWARALRVKALKHRSRLLTYPSSKISAISTTLLAESIASCHRKILISAKALLVHKDLLSFSYERPSL